jgi:DNA-binding CsgD family transcriptional regulator/tetratricopeptide (TPR) repeat protein
MRAMNMVGPLVCPILVGRDDLLALAERRLEQAAGGRGHVLFLAGEAGIGKTRLLGSIERRAATLGFRVARGGTYPGDLEVPGAVFLELARVMRRTPALAASGEQVAARLASADSVADGTPDGDAHRRRRLLTLDVADDLAAVAADGPTLLCLEDLHQADDLTLEIVANLARRAVDLPLVVLATYRSDELYPRVPMREWRARLLAQRQAEEARLRRLDLDETATMASVLLAAGEPAPRDIAVAIHDRTDGIPLHVEELIGLLGASGTANLAATAQDVPDTLEAAILGRFGLRSPEAQSVARIGSVIGRSFEYDLLAGVVGVQVDDGDTLDAPLAELADHFLLAAAPASGRYGFRHALICDAIYARIPDAERRRLHARVAEIASARGDFSDAFLSLQLERAGKRVDAFDAARRAGAAATMISAHREAFELYARALRNAPPDLQPAERAELLEAHAREASAIDDNRTAADGFEAAREAWLRADRPLDAAEAVVPLVGALHLLGADLAQRTGRLDEALDSVRTAAGQDGWADAARATSRAAGRIEAGLAAAYMLSRQLDEGVAHADAARALATEAVDDATLRNADVTLGVCLAFRGEVEASVALLERQIAAARTAGAEAEASRGYRMLGSVASVIVEYERGERWLRDGIDLAERVERWNDRHYLAAHLAHVLWATGRWDDAEAVAEHAKHDGRGGITTRITADHVLGYVALGRGELDRAEASLEEARVAGARMGELQRLSPALWGLAEVALQRGDPQAAIRWVEAGRLASLEVRDAAYLFPFAVTGTRAHLAASDPSGAVAFLDAVEDELRHRSIPGTLPAIDHARGLLALHVGSTVEARRRLSAAVEGWGGRRRAWEGAWARVDLARAYQRANRRPDSARLGVEVEALADGLGSVPLHDAARSLRGRPGSPDDGAPWSPLTGREWEVATLVADGLTNGEVAARLGLATRTASAHVEHILAKLGVGRRAEIAAWVAGIRTPRQP